MSKYKRQSAGVIIISTFPTQESVTQIAKELIVNKKLCACINLTKIRSLYFWKNKLENQEEFITLFKTTKFAADKLKSEIKKIHPYEVPEIVELKMNDVSKAYLSWMMEMTMATKARK